MKEARLKICSPVSVIQEVILSHCYNQESSTESNAYSADLIPAVPVKSDTIP